MTNEDVATIDAGADDAPAAGAAADPARAAAEEPASLAGGEPEANPERWYSEDWRERMADGDPAMLKFLQGQESPAALARATRGLRQELSKRGPTRPGDDASDEDWASWRKSQGIPGAANEYRAAMTLPDNYDPERHAGVLDEYASVFYANHIPTAQANEMVNAYFDMEARQQQEFTAAVAQNQRAARHDLSEEWGGAKEFDTNIMALKRFAGEKIGDQARDDLFESIIVDSQGRPVGRLGDHPAFLRLTVGAARETFGDDLPMLDGGMPDENLSTRLNDLDEKYTRSLKPGSGVRWTPADDDEYGKLAQENERRVKRANFAR